MWHTGVAARTQPSQTPKITLIGAIEVRNGNGVSLGYISTQTASNGMFRYDSPVSDTTLLVRIEVDAGATSASDVNVNMIVGPLLIAQFIQR